MRRIILVFFTSALTAVIIALCVVLKYGNIELQIVKHGKAVEKSQNVGAPEEKNLPSEQIVTFRVEDYNEYKKTARRFYCNATKGGYFRTGLHSHTGTDDIIVPQGQKWVFKDYKVDYPNKRYSRPFIVYKCKGSSKKFQLPEDGRDFILFPGDVFFIGMDLLESEFEYLEVSVIFHVEYL